MTRQIDGAALITDKTVDMSSGRRTYTAPAVREEGRVEDLTAGAGSSVSDGAGTYRDA